MARSGLIEEVPQSPALLVLCVLSSIVAIGIVAVVFELWASPFPLEYLSYGYLAIGFLSCVAIYRDIRRIEKIRGERFKELTYPVRIPDGVLQIMWDFLFAASLVLAPLFLPPYILSTRRKLLRGCQSAFTMLICVTFSNFGLSFLLGGQFRPWIKLSNLGEPSLFDLVSKSILENGEPRLLLDFVIEGFPREAQLLLRLSVLGVFASIPFGFLGVALIWKSMWKVGGRFLSLSVACTIPSVLTWLCMFPNSTLLGQGALFTLAGGMWMAAPAFIVIKSYKKWIQEGD